MRLPRILILVGAFISIIPIALSIAAFATPNWANAGIMNATSNVNYTIPYSLLACNVTICPPSSSLLKTAQGLEITGLVLIILGVIAIVVLDIITDNRWIHLLPQIPLIAAPTLILIGLIVYVMYVMQHLSTLIGYFNISWLRFEFSFILMIIACVIGYVIAVYFAFVAGIGRYPRRISSSNVIQRTDRF